MNDSKTWFCTECKVDNHTECDGYWKSGINSILCACTCTGIKKSKISTHCVHCRGNDNHDKCTGFWIHNPQVMCQCECKSSQLRLPYV